MIPIRDSLQTSSYPLINNLIITVNVAVFLFTIFLGVQEIDQFINFYAFTPSKFSFTNIITSQFIHGSIGHILGNMLFLYVFGNSLEDYLGHIKYILFYLFCGFTAILTQYFISPFSNIPILGASGAIAGVMGAYLILFPKSKIDILFPFGLLFPTISVSASTMLIYWIAAQFLQGFGSLDYHGGGIAYFAHIGGFFAGIVFIRLFPKSKKAFFRLR